MEPKHKIKLSKADTKELLDLYQRAQNAPVIWIGGTKDRATLAWEDVNRKLDELGKKYGFDSKKFKGVKPSTGEVLLEGEEK